MAWQMATLLVVLGLIFPATVELPEFTAFSPDAKQPTGRLLSLTSQFTLTLATRDGEAKVADVVSLRRVGYARPSFPAVPHIVTTTGDRIVGIVVSGDDQSLRFLPSDMNSKPDDAWRIPFSSAAAIWLVDLPAGTSLDPYAYPWVFDLKNQDVLRFRNGDVARVALDAFAADAGRAVVSFRPDRGAIRKVASRELAAVVFNPALSRARKPKTAYARMVLANGTRIAIANLTIADQLVKGETLFGQSVSFPLNAVIAIDVVGGKAEFLSDLKPKEVTQSGFLGVAWTWRSDRGIHGGPLRVKTEEGTSTVDKGLSTHPRTTLRYDLKGQYQRFEALVGLDPDVGAAGSASIQILVDGKDHWPSAIRKLTPGRALAIQIDVRGGKELELVTDYGDAGGVGADVNWGDARLLK